MRVFVPTIWEEATTHDHTTPKGLEYLSLAGAEAQFLKGPWGIAFSQLIQRTNYMCWLHYFSIIENNTTLFASAAKESLALLMVRQGRLSGSFMLNSYQSTLLWIKGQIRSQWVLPKGETIIAEFDFNPSFEKGVMPSAGKTAYLSRNAQVLLQTMPGNLSAQSAPGLYLDGIAASLLHEHIIQVLQQDDAALLANPPFHFLQKDLNNIRRVKARIDASIDKRWSVKELASFAGTNRDIVNRGFKYVYGQTVHQYWLAISLSYAKELVIGSTESIKNIAAACGFDQYSHFIQQFKKHWGLTPGEMRKTI